MKEAVNVCKDCIDKECPECIWHLPEDEPDFPIYTVSGGRVSIGVPEEELKCAYCGSREGVKFCWSTHIVEGHGEVTGSVPYCEKCRSGKAYNFEVEE